MENTKSRLKQFIEKQGISGRKFSEKIGASENYFNVTNSIGSEYLEKIHTAFDELNMDWVITGRGDMTVEEDIAIPNYIHRNISFLIRNSPPHFSFTQFGKSIGIDYERSNEICIKNTTLPTKKELKRISILYNIPLDKLIHEDLTKIEFEIDTSTFPIVWRWEFKNIHDNNFSVAAEKQSQYGTDWKSKYYECIEKYNSLLESNHDKKTDRETG